MKVDQQGWIKPAYDRTETINGLKYYICYKWYVVILLRIVKFIQKGLWLCGIAVHDPVFGECTPDFNCCCNIGRCAFIRIGQKKHYNLKEV